MKPEQICKYTHTYIYEAQLHRQKQCAVCVNAD